MPQDEVLRVAEGRVWTGAQARERGLVDQLGGFADALAATRQEIGLEADAPIALRRFPQPRTLWEHALHYLVAAPLRLGIDAWLERLTPGALTTPPITIR
jgi:protease-4